VTDARPLAEPCGHLAAETRRRGEQGLSTRVVDRRTEVGEQRCRGVGLGGASRRAWWEAGRRVARFDDGAQRVLATGETVVVVVAAALADVDRGRKDLSVAIASVVDAHSVCALSTYCVYEDWRPCAVEAISSGTVRRYDVRLHIGAFRSCQLDVVKYDVANGATLEGSDGGLRCRQ